MILFFRKVFPALPDYMLRPTMLHFTAAATRLTEMEGDDEAVIEISQRSIENFERRKIEKKTWRADIKEEKPPAKKHSASSPCGERRRM